VSKVPVSFRKQHMVVLVCVLLAAVTMAAYWPVRHCDFVNYDDNLYVTGNPHVLGGLSMENVKWTFTALDTANWHPLTWISLMADARDGEADAERFHTTNLLLHLANVLLLFLLLRRLSRSTWKSAFVTALFAVHPLHVESVAWVSERKDVLSTLFWLLTTWAYVRYTEKQGFARYAPVMVLFALGLMCKPMLVTLPITLLLLDFWPLRRLQTADNRQRKGLGKQIAEKIPLLALSIVSSAVTFYAQRGGSAMETVSKIPITARISNAIVSYALYLWKMAWPAKLAVLYPHPGPTLPQWLIAVSAALLVCVTTLAIMARRRRPYLMVGWLWYMITLVPVIGIIQVGEQSMADRYTYIPLIGIFVMIAWGVPGLLGKEERKKGRKGAPVTLTSTEHPTPKTFLVPMVILAIAAIAVLAWRTWVQIGYWQDSVALFGHAIEVTERNPTAYYNLGRTVVETGQYDESIRCYRKAIEYSPDFANAHGGLAVVLFLTGDYAGAWKEVHTFEALGGTPHPGLIHDLSEAMPDPGR